MDQEGFGRGAYSFVEIDFDVALQSTVVLWQSATSSFIVGSFADRGATGQESFEGGCLSLRSRTKGAVAEILLDEGTGKVGW
jgi:hypothetical protein